MFLISNIQPVEKGFYSFEKIGKELKFLKKREMEKIYKYQRQKDPLIEAIKYYRENLK